MLSSVKERVTIHGSLPVCRRYCLDSRRSFRESSVAFAERKATLSYRPVVICGAILCGVAVLLLLGGCGGDGLRKIHGTVTYLGKPITKGRIEFWPPDGNGPTAAAPIIHGQFALPIMPGRKLVKILGFKVIGKRPASLRHPDGVMVDEEVQIVPESL